MPKSLIVLRALELPTLPFLVKTNIKSKWRKQTRIIYKVCYFVTIGQFTYVLLLFGPLHWEVAVQECGKAVFKYMAMTLAWFGKWVGSLFFCVGQINILTSRLLTVFVSTRNTGTYSMKYNCRHP